jgi:hypothetical protein
MVSIATACPIRAQTTYISFRTVPLGATIQTRSLPAQAAFSQVKRMTRKLPSINFNPSIAHHG